MSACEVGALCCKSSPCAYLAVDGNAEELAALRAEVERLRGALGRIEAIRWEDSGERPDSYFAERCRDASVIAAKALAKEPGDEG